MCEPKGHVILCNLYPLFFAAKVLPLQRLKDKYTLNEDKILVTSWSVALLGQSQRNHLNLQQDGFEFNIRKNVLGVKVIYIYKNKGRDTLFCLTFYVIFPSI